MACSSRALFHGTIHFHFHLATYMKLCACRWYFKGYVDNRLSCKDLVLLKKRFAKVFEDSLAEVCPRASMRLLLHGKKKNLVLACCKLSTKIVEGLKRRASSICPASSPLLIRILLDCRH